MWKYHFSACEASSRLSYINLTLACVVLLLTVLYNDQLPLITDQLACWSVLRPFDYFTQIVGCSEPWNPCLTFRTITGFNASITLGL